MLKKVASVTAAAVVYSCGAALAFTYAPLAAVQTMVVHASGAVTGGVHVSGTATSQPPASSTPPAASTTPGATAPPASQALPVLVPVSSQNGGGGSAPSVTAPVTGGGIAPSHRQAGFAGRGSASAASPARKVIVALLNGGHIDAGRMSMGLHDLLSVKNGKTVVAVALARIAGVEFGEKELGRLAVTVNMVDGTVLTGNVYPGTVFEFEETGRVSATRAEEIASIRFPAE